MTDPIAMLYTLLQRSASADIVPPEPVIPWSGGNVLAHMDNLTLIRSLPPASVDFIYIDPPFASNGTYYQQITLPDRKISRIAYTDTWEHGMTSYLEFLVPRLQAMQHLLKPTGSICVHVGHHSNHYVKAALDAIYGGERMINEVIWRYGKMSNTRRRLPQNHDTLLIYAASDDWYFQPLAIQESEYRTRFLRDLSGNQLLYGSVKHRNDKLIHRRIRAKERELERPLEDDDVLFDFDTERKLQDDVFTDISIVRGNAREGVGFDTQKPVKLLERLMTAFCSPGGVVADFFCGSGTTGMAANTLGRTWIMSDSGLPAIQTTRERLGDLPYQFVPDTNVTPQTFELTEEGAIADFRMQELELQSHDEQYIRELLTSDPDSLLVHQADGTVQDVFGRSATRSRGIC